MKRTITQVKEEIRHLTDWYYLTHDKRVLAVIDQIRKENASKVEALNQELAELKKSKPEPKPSWPKDTPGLVLKECDEFWSGTEEFHNYRIHCWNDRVICTGWPSGGYGTAGGWNKVPATFVFISRSDKMYGKAKELASLNGRQSQKMLQKKLDEITLTITE